MNAIRHRLKELMKANDLSAPKLSRRSGVPLGSIKSILNGQSLNPRAATLQALSRTLNCHISQLLSNHVLADRGMESHDISTDEILFKASLDVIKTIAAEKGVDLEGRDEFKKRCVHKVFAYARDNIENDNLPRSVDRVYAEWVFNKEWEKEAL